MNRSWLQIGKAASIGTLGALAIAGGAYAATSGTAAPSTSSSSPGTIATAPAYAAAVTQGGMQGGCVHSTGSGSSAETSS